MSPETVIAVSHKAAELETALRRVIRGKDDVVRLALVSIFARGHLLIEGVPGVGKTTLGQALARAIDCTFQRVQFTSDMLPSDVVGISIYSTLDHEFEFKRGPVFTNVLLADEINRTTPKTQSALLEAMNEGQVTVDAHSYELPQPFLVIATQNPVEHHGTYPLPESQLDRFLMRVRMGYPDAQAERQILRSEAGAAHLDDLSAVLTGAEVLEMQQAVKQIRVDESLVSYALEIVRRTRESEFLSLGVSPRGSQALYRAAQAMAFLEGRTFCTPEDIKPLVGPGLRPPHRGQRALRLDPEKIRAVGSGAQGNHRGRRSAGVRELLVLSSQFSVLSSQHLVLSVSSVSSVVRSFVVRSFWPRHRDYNPPVMSFLRFLMLLSLVIWIGGIVFFAIMAPTAFHVLPTRLLAGTLVGNLLTKLHWIAIVSGVVYLISSLAYSRLTDGTAHVFATRHVLICGMLALTLVSQFWITPRMADAARAGRKL